MAEPTEQQIRQMEAAHKDLLLTIIATCKLWFDVLGDIALLPDSDPRKITFKEWTNDIVGAIGSWFASQKEYESSGISNPVQFKPGDFFDEAKLNKLDHFKTEYANSIGQFTNYPPHWA